MEEQLKLLGKQLALADDQRRKLLEAAKILSKQARAEGMSAQRVATAVGVSKRTVQVWTD